MIWLLLASLALAQPATPDVPFRGQVSASFTVSGQPPLKMPTDVAIGPDGGIFVADGVNDRILHFASNGEVRAIIDRIDEQRLSRPLGLDVDRSGKLWIADTGNQRVLCVSPELTLEHQISVSSGTAGRTPSLTDVAARRDGKFAWIADNYNHRLISVELETGIQSVAGHGGESLGQLNHPFFLSEAPNGNVLVTDVLNGRISSFTASGQPSPGISRFGVDLGEVYRPKGIAHDAQGNIWVSDSVMCVVQVFSASGRFIDVLRDKDGKPLRLQTPTGIAFDADGNLYVVELSADRVSRISITAGQAVPVSIPARQDQRLTGNQARSCTTCHLEWLEPFSAGRSTALMDPPPTSSEEPYVSRSEVCLSCHDGSMADSRRRVWQEHGHRTGVEPPDTMKVPSGLPLVAGKIACRTCHSAHVSGQFNADASKAVFLRVKNESSELCVSCHTDKTRGPSFGTHPTGGMPWPVPKNLIAAGARTGLNPRELTCQVCHTPHGSSYDHLLVLGTSSNELCISCHDQMRPGMFREGPHIEHPLQPTVNAEQETAVRLLGTKLGPDNKLICLSCHKLHHGKGEHYMLAEDLTDGQFCIRCHSEKTSVLNTSHDLRTNFPEERNRLGMTPQSGGPCSSCHLFHRYARAPESSPLDPGGGKCITCHQADRCAEKKKLGPINHPKAACTECHDPHSTKHPPFLDAPTTELCVECHAANTALVGGPHDSLRNGKDWPGESLAQSDRCLSCHRPHGTHETGLFRVAPAASAAAADGACLACHPNSNWTANGNMAALHPRQFEDGLEVALPTVTTSDGDQAIGCSTCHNPHTNVQHSPSLLRVSGDSSSQDLCTTCHSPMAAISLTGHSLDRLSTSGIEANACQPCHNVHGNRADFGPRLLSTSLLGLHQENQASGSTCAACHSPGGPAKLPKVATHPDIPSFSPGMVAESTLPLFDSRGHKDSAGKITCNTCHIPHGRLPDLEGSPADSDAVMASVDKLLSLPVAQRSAMRLMLRPFESPNICINCHGQDGLRRFLYFHDEQRRRGSLDPALGQAVIRRPRL